jgi:hypothetical protein
MLAPNLNPIWRCLWLQMLSASILSEDVSDSKCFQHQSYLKMFLTPNAFSITPNAFSINPIWRCFWLRMLSASILSEDVSDSKCFQHQSYLKMFLTPNAFSINPIWRCLNQTSILSGDVCERAQPCISVLIQMLSALLSLHTICSPHNSRKNAFLDLGIGVL